MNPYVVGKLTRMMNLQQSTMLLVLLILVFALLSGCAEEQLVEEQSADESIYMFNALWFKEDGGAEKYSQYGQAAGPLVRKHGGIGGKGEYVPEQALIGEFDADLVFMVEWPSMAAFTDLMEDPEYQAIRHLREEAIVDSLLISFRKL